MRKLVTPWRLLAAGAALTLVALAALWLVPSDDYLILPDPAHPVAPLVTVEKPKSGGGSDNIYFVDIIERHATLLESLFPSIRHGSTKVPGSQVNPFDVSDAVRRHVDLSQMARSQEIAAAVAMRMLGYHVDVSENGAFVLSVFPNLPARGRVDPGEVIVGVDGQAVRTTDDLQRLVASRKPGTRMTLTLRGTQSDRKVTLTTAPNPQDSKHSVIGVLVEPAARIKLPFDVKIDAGNIGGPSAGLAFALDLMEKLGRDVDHGHPVAATGELGLDGSVNAIGGIKQKTLGAREADVEVFLVPVENADEAKRYAGDMRIIPVRTVREAVRALAALPRTTAPSG